MPYKVLVMGASYGSLLAFKVLFGDHTIHPLKRRELEGEVVLAPPVWLVFGSVWIRPVTACSKRVPDRSSPGATLKCVRNNENMEMVLKRIAEALDKRLEIRFVAAKPPRAA
jgi:hypothetical protein